MSQEDVPAADALRGLIGWNQTLNDWRRMLELEPEGCFVALRGAAVVGTVTTISYGAALGWIGMMLVHPDHRRQGIASRLMAQAIDYLRAEGIGCIKLDATPAGRPVYEKLGFVSEWELARWQIADGHSRSVAPKGISTRPLQPRDWHAAVKLDEASFGVGRGQLLRSLAQDCQAAQVWPTEGAVMGWGMLRVGANAGYLGPLVSSKVEGAEALAIALLHAAGNRSVYWDIPQENDAAKAIAQKLGFVPVRPLTRMYLGSNAAAGDTRLLFGITDPALG